MSITVTFAPLDRFSLNLIRSCFIASKSGTSRNITKNFIFTSYNQSSPRLANSTMIDPSGIGFGFCSSGQYWQSDGCQDSSPLAASIIHHAPWMSHAKSTDQYPGSCSPNILPMNDICPISSPHIAFKECNRAFQSTG